VTNLVTPDVVELEEIRQTQGDDAVLARSAQMLRNERRRTFHSERKRYAEIAMNMNLRRAAETLAERKLAEQQAQQKPDTAKKPPASVTTDPHAGIESSDRAALTPTGSDG
jgi:hypothetical protein